MISLFKNFPIPTKAGDTKQWGGLNDAKLALAITAISNQSAGPVICIAQNNQSVAQLDEEISFLSQGRIPVYALPDWEILPYDTFSPHQDIISERIKTLALLPTLKEGIVLLSVSTLLHRLPPKQFITSQSFDLSTGQVFDLHRTRTRLEESGYHCVDTVYEHGEFAIRGAIIDIFPMGSQYPLRIELFDNEIDTIRTFDPETQRSVEKLSTFTLLPAKEFPVTSESIKQFRNKWREQFEGKSTNASIYQDMSSGIIPAGIEYYLPLFFDACETIFDFLPSHSIFVTENDATATMEAFWNEVSNRYEQRRHDIQRPILAPESIILRANECNAQLNKFPKVILKTEQIIEKAGSKNVAHISLPDLRVDHRAENPIENIKIFIAEHPNTKLLFSTESVGRRESLLSLFQRNGLPIVEAETLDDFLNATQHQLMVSPLERGLDVRSHHWMILTENELFGQRVYQKRRRQKQQTQVEDVFRDISELSIGSPVVHIDHGVGRYQGLEVIEAGGFKNEFLTLSYADDAKLYVPVTNLHLIARFTGTSNDSAPLHKLGSEKWSQAKQKAQEKVRDTAAELLDIYARREAQRGYGFIVNENEYFAFANGFPFEETADQACAIEAVLADMQSPRPMDRLVCGDVGFGKTEVAMRAAFIAAHGGRQVSILVPTTLLAQQHFESFRDRFADWPIEIEVLSRFQTAKEQKIVLDKLAQGKVDIIIGTHKLIQDDVKFKNLGLLIIDEEHRFGVQQKEKLKSMRANVDILTLTATPIPRTLNMAMSQIRDLSIIATPPARRLSVKTFVRPSDEHLIKEAIMRELLRGGQVYYLHNEVSTIEETARSLLALVPEARIAIGHGQMRETQLEQVMADFYHKRANILVCTTIVETGIDVPNANTMIIDRADKFGLAQLHQLRGRVGRSHHQAYAYLLTPTEKKLTSDAEKRLEAIEHASDLGAGFSLASHDLEIRGAGELLGDDQSGQMQTIGFTLYMELLDDAVKSIREGKTPNMAKPLRSGTEVNLNVASIIPDDYINDVHTRLLLYKRIASAKNEDLLDNIQVEMIDRFGLLPEPTKRMFRVAELKLQAAQLGIVKIEVGAKHGVAEFGADTTVEPIKIIQLIQKAPLHYKMHGATAIKFYYEMENVEQRFKVVDNLLKVLA